MPRYVPARVQRGELLEQGVGDLRAVRANLREMELGDRLLGGRRAIVARVGAWIDTLPNGYRPRILDVATGNAALPGALYRWSRRHGRRVELQAGDLSAEVLLVARDALGNRPVLLLRFDALRMPFADAALDIVTCTQALHHFDREAAIRLLGELARVARIGVVVNDLRRSYMVYWLARLVALGPVTRLGRHDGPLSVLRAYTPDEVSELLRAAGLHARVRRTPFRLLIEVHKRDRPLPAVV